MSKREIDLSDLQKVENALHDAYMYFLHRDEMNSKVHLKKPIQSPITTQTMLAWERVNMIIQGELVAYIED